MYVMVVRDRHIHGIGKLTSTHRSWRVGQSASSYVHVRAIDKEGRSISDTNVFLFKPGEGAASERMKTNGGGWAIVPARGFEVGSQVELAVELPEGTAYRKAETGTYSSGHVEVFQSVTTLPESVLTIAEAVGFGLGITVTAVGLYLRNRGAQEVVVGLGSGLFAVSGFSMVFRHLR